MEKNNHKGWLYLLPAIAFLGIFMVYPIIDVLIYSFEEGYNFASQTYFGIGGYNGASYSFCVERYLTGPETDVYKAFAELKVGDKVDMEGFLYWYEGVNTHITSVKAAG